MSTLEDEPRNGGQNFGAGGEDQYLGAGELHAQAGGEKLYEGWD